MSDQEKASSEADKVKGEEGKPDEKNEPRTSDDAKASDAKAGDAKASDAKDKASRDDEEDEDGDGDDDDADGDEDGDGKDDEDGEDEEEEEEEEEEETSDEDDDKHDDDSGDGKRKPVVVIEDTVEAERADQVASYQPDEKPVSVRGAVIGGLVGSMIGGILWWGLMRVSGYELGLVAIGVGILAGLGVVRGGGRSSTNQLIGAVCGLVGILLGRVLFYYFGFDEMVAKELARKEGVSIEVAKIGLQILRDNGTLTLGTYMKETLQAMDILFFGIGMFEGWRIPRPLS